MSMTQCSGCLQSDWMTLMVISDELETMIESEGATSSIFAKYDLDRYVQVHFPE